MVFWQNKLIICGVNPAWVNGLGWSHAMFVLVLNALNDESNS